MVVIAATVERYDALSFLSAIKATNLLRNVGSHSLSITLGAAPNLPNTRGVNWPDNEVRIGLNR